MLTNIINTTPTSSTLYLDSRVSYHVTNNFLNIQQWVPYEGPYQIFIGNGQGLPISSFDSTTFLSSLAPNTSLVYCISPLLQRI